MKKQMELLMGIVMLLMIAGIVNHAIPMTSNLVDADTRFTVVIDAGHGGSDPGKVGVNEALEKEINLKIALQLKGFLESSDVTVYLTREEDKGLYSMTDRNKKMADMQKRTKLIEEVNPDLVISVHQNSFPQESVKGGQVFYYKNSEKGKLLAEILQKNFGEMSGMEKKRDAKANDNYYLLLHVSAPIVIVECGFLSNKAEAALLIQEEYQERVAWTIHMGVMEYLNTTISNKKILYKGNLTMDANVFIANAEVHVEGKLLINKGNISGTRDAVIRVNGDFRIQSKEESEEYYETSGFMKLTYNSKMIVGGDCILELHGNFNHIGDTSFKTEDGAAWIQNTWDPDTMFQLDRFHIQQDILRKIRDKKA